MRVATYYSNLHQCGFHILSCCLTWGRICCLVISENHPSDEDGFCLFWKFTFRRGGFLREVYGYANKPKSESSGIPGNCQLLLLSYGQEPLLAIWSTNLTVTIFWCLHICVYTHTHIYNMYLYIICVHVWYLYHIKHVSRIL